MSYLVYCVMKNLRALSRPAITGINGQPAFVMAEGALGAVVSAIGEDRAQLEDLVAFAEAVAAFNRTQTVLPMRYGCRLDSAAQVRGWLRGHSAEFRALLEMLDGCVEIGVRALLAPHAATVGDAPARAAASSAGPGAAYLAARRAELIVHDHADHVAQTIQSAVSGWFRQCVVENGWSGQDPMLSLYFLVPRNALLRFRHAFSRIGSIKGAALMLSGPWPPYNFVHDLTVPTFAAAGLGDDNPPAPRSR